MKFNYLKSSELPNIDPYVKECINSGQWFLFKAQTSNAQVAFFLKADEDIFALDVDGNMVPSLQLGDGVGMKELFYFNDVPRPISLSNQFAANC